MLTERVKILTNDITSPSLQLNHRKTRYYGNKEVRMITGLMLTGDGKVLVPRSAKRYLRSLIRKKHLGILEEGEYAKLRGYVSFIKDNEPSYLDKLVYKYGSIF